MSDEMTRDELLALMRAWGWRMESERPGRYQVWEHPGGRIAIVPSDPEKTDYDRLMKRAWGTLAAAEAPRTLGIVREVARLHPREAVTCLNPTHGDDCDGQVCGTCGDAWPCRTIVAIDAAPTETKEKNR